MSVAKSAVSLIVIICDSYTFVGDKFDFINEKQYYICHICGLPNETHRNRGLRIPIMFPERGICRPAKRRLRDNG